MNQNEQLARDALRASMRAQGFRMKNSNMTLTEEDLEAIGTSVVNKVREVLLVELGRLVWDGIRKVVIGGAIGLMALNQISGWLTK